MGDIEGSPAGTVVGVFVPAGASIGHCDHVLVTVVVDITGFDVGAKGASSYLAFLPGRVLVPD